MLLLVNFGRKRPWEKNKNKAHIPSGGGKNAGPHPGGTRPVGEETFWRGGQGRNTGPYLVKVSEVRWTAFSG